eukprot:SM000011S18954  [mRNA]  locus=s11:10308:11829:- [translate_table: standard]
MTAPPAAATGSRASPPAPEALEEAFVACLDAADRLLASREALFRALQADWFDLARARYSMGPSSIGRLQYNASPSLAPPATTVGLAAAGDDGVPRLILQARQAGQAEKGAGKPPLVITPGSPPSPAAASGNPELDDLVSSISLAASPCMEERATPSTKPVDKLSGDALCWFGTLVSPHLRAASVSFQEDSLTGSPPACSEVANTQSEVDYSRIRYLELKGGTAWRSKGATIQTLPDNNNNKSDAMAPEPELKTQDLARSASP